MTKIPADYVNYKSTPVFEKHNVPKMFLHLHNTKAGVYGQIQVLSGALKFYGFRDRRGEVEQELIINTGDTGISPPQYWHKVELLTDNTQFRVDFWAQQDSDIVIQNLSERD
ncbi:DUF1971 domain-containing protein [Shewanella schlegeliana]|uniref:DUF1971 domain-containing protein n=1 Tax=Shewanella schlegeliana TaxID=190308 RepID=A0ABS1SUX3_9GAMM|nr:DUF1971 domain-containing protein [Shewanella schlegeliana]MBL4912330.1 DUF1971 domain-containing protein [Shewanella schlegeliana]MCL1108201.1 DUF1971 domain-containing protein [Shewanella schlegeliana]GIU22172.1 hypothetical protein TUM4433_02600 [Shewanella schlegeliana]